MPDEPSEARELITIRMHADAVLTEEVSSYETIEGSCISPSERPEAVINAGDRPG